MAETYDWDDPLPRPKCFDHFENSAYNTASDSGHAELKALHTQPSPLTALKNDCAAKVISLADLPNPQPEGENPAALFCNGWLRKGGGAFLVSTSGTGKSVLTIQAALLWTMGKSAFGIKPVRPIRVAIVQAEDDNEEVADFRNQITDGLVDDGVDRDAVREAWGKVRLADATGKTGEGFIAFVDEAVRTWADIDLIIVNPFQSYFGGDISRNAELSQFLRAGIDPLIKPDKVGVLFIHHTNKPPSAKDRQGWGADAFTAYIGAGGAELANWARATLALMPCEHEPKIFRLVAGKRGQRLGWVDANGDKTLTRFFAHSKTRIYWREANPEEQIKAQDGLRTQRKLADPEADARQLADKLQGRPLKLMDVRSLSGQTFTRTRARNAIDRLKANPGSFGLFMAQAEWKACVFIGVKAEAEAAARAYDAQMRKAKSDAGVLPE